MKTQLKARPQSKSFKGEGRPVSRMVNKQQAIATFQQAKQEQNQNAYQKAIELYLRATIYDPKYYQAYCNIGSCYRSLHQYAEACRFYQKAISIKSDDAISHYNLANAERLIGNYEQAILHYNFVISLKQQKKEDIGSLYLDSLINVGICFKNKQLFEKANQCYQKALKINGKDESALFNYGMSIVRSLKGIDNQLFQEVTKEKAEKASSLFKRLLQVNKQSIIAEFQILRMSVLLDRTSENVSKVIQKLKKILATPKCSIAEEINLEMAFCLNLIKQYQQSSKQYNKSLTNFAPKKQSNKNIYDNSGGFIDTPISNNSQFITEEQGMKMLEEGLYQDLKDQIIKLPQSQSKHVLELALEIYLVQIDNGSLQKALDIYAKYFKKGGVDLPMDKISIQGHKVIGKLLSIQQEFKESIKHFEYISGKLSSQKQKSQIHSSLATDYEGLGDRARAMAQIKLALSSQPDNFEFVYNAGCLFHQQGAYSEALPYFQKFLDLIHKQTNIQMVKKNLYIADCFVTMAACKNQLQSNKLLLYPLYEKAWNSVKEVKSQVSENFEFEEQRLLRFYLEWADILEMKLAQTPDRRNQEFIHCKQMLLETYVCLLQSQTCPDRDPILSNCASIYYEQKLYVNALANYNLIFDGKALSYNNLALTYLHLREHYMASMLIFKAVEDPTQNKIENFNKSVICWIYGIETEGEEAGPLFSKFSNNSDQSMLSRLEYGLLLIDAFSNKISKLPELYQFSQLQNAMKDVINSDHLQEYYEQSEHAKLKLLVTELKRVVPKKEDDVDTGLLESCLVQRENIESQFIKLIDKLANNDSLSQSVSQILINLFIFINRKHSSSLRSVLNSFLKENQQFLSLNLDRRVTITSELTKRTFGNEYTIRKIEDLVLHFINWQTQLESKLLVLIKTIQKYYYKTKIRKPLEIEYNFPRHSQWEQDTSSILRIAYLILSGFKTSINFVLKGKSISQMRHQVYSQLQQAFIQKFQKNQVVEVAFGNRFTPVTLYTYHESKKDCLMFLKDLQKQSSDKSEIEIGRDCKELIVNVNNILRIRCQWQQPKILVNVIKAISEHPLPLDVQSVLGLQSELYILKQTSEKNRELLESYEVLREQHEDH